MMGPTMIGKIRLDFENVLNIFTGDDLKVLMLENHKGYRVQGTLIVITKYSVLSIYIGVPTLRHGVQIQ